MTTDITDQDEREAIIRAQDNLEWCQEMHLTDEHETSMRIGTLRALLHRATRAHD